MSGKRQTARERKRAMLRRMQDAYRAVFGRQGDGSPRDEAIEMVLRDLGFFARRDERVRLAEGERRLDRIEGRREMLWRIEDHLLEDFETLFIRYDGIDGKPVGKEEAWLMKQDREQRARRAPATDQVPG